MALLTVLLTKSRTRSIRMAVARALDRVLLLLYHDTHNASHRHPRIRLLILPRTEVLDWNREHAVELALLFGVGRESGDGAVPEQGDADATDLLKGFVLGLTVNVREKSHELQERNVLGLHELDSLLGKPQDSFTTRDSDFTEGLTHPAQDKSLASITPSTLFRDNALICEYELSNVLFRGFELGLVLVDDVVGDT